MKKTRARVYTGFSDCSDLCLERINYSLEREMHDMKSALKRMSRFATLFCCIALAILIAIYSIPIPLNVLFPKRDTEEYWMEVNRGNGSISILAKEEVKQLIDKSKEISVKFRGFIDLKDLPTRDVLYVYRINTDTEERNRDVIILALDDDENLQIACLPDRSKGCIYTFVGGSENELSQLVFSAGRN